MSSLLSRLSLRQLECFLAVVDQGGMRAAAEHLGLSQPPLTRHLHSLEALIGAPLFERHGRGVVLTPLGESFVAPCRTALAAVERAVSQAQQQALSPADQPWIIACTPVVDVEAQIPLRSVLARLGIAATLRSLTTVHALTELRRGSLTAAILGLPLESQAERCLCVTPLARQPLLLACAQDDSLADPSRELTVAALAERPLLWFQRRSAPAFYDHCEAVFLAAGYAPQRLPEPPEHTLILGAVARGEAVAFVPASLAALQHPAVRFRPLPPALAPFLAIHLAFAYRSDSPFAERLHAMAEALKTDTKTVLITQY